MIHITLNPKLTVACDSVSDALALVKELAAFDYEPIDQRKLKLQEQIIADLKHRLGIEEPPKK